MCGLSEKPKETRDSLRQFGASTSHFSETTRPKSTESTRPKLKDTSNETSFEDFSLPNVSGFTSRLEEIDECNSPREVTITKIVKSPATGNIVEYTTAKIITATKKDNETSSFTINLTFPKRDDTHKVSGSESHTTEVPVCARPFGWNVTGVSAPVKHPEASHPLIEPFAPSAPTLEDTIYAVPKSN